MLPPADSSAWVLMRGDSATDSPGTRQIAARLAFLAAKLELVDSLPDVPQEIVADLDEAVARVPNQLRNIGREHRALSWLQLAALGEFTGLGGIARILVDQIARLAGGDSELLAICECRRGRIARLAGDLEDAEYHYRDALHRTRALPLRDAWPLAMSGLSNVHIDRGNFPAAQRCLERMLAAGDGIHASHRRNAWMGLTLVRRKRGAPLEAMLCAWNAFDLTQEGTPERTELLVTLAECSTEYGDYHAAANGFLQAYRAATSTRVRIAAITGLVRSLSRFAGNAGTRSPLERSASHGATLREALDALDSLLATPLAPQEHALALIARVEAWMVSGPNRENVAQVTQWIELARRLSGDHGLHEYQFRVDELASHVDTMSGEAGLLGMNPPPDAAARAPKRRHAAASNVPPALRRLAAYTPA